MSIRQIETLLLLGLAAVAWFNFAQQPDVRHFRAAALRTLPLL
jgi:hypothetical protein